MAMKLRSNYHLRPGHCRLCNSAVTPVIDTGRGYDSNGYGQDFGGVMYICANCADEIAQVRGCWVHENAFDEAKERMKEAEAYADQLETELADAKAELEVFSELDAMISARAGAQIEQAQRPVKRGPGRPRKSE